MWKTCHVLRCEESTLLCGPGFAVELNTLGIKFTWKNKQAITSQENSERQGGWINLSGFKIAPKASVGLVNDLRFLYKYVYFLPPI